MSELYISNVGIRNYEYITSSSKATANKNTIIQVKGNYPPYLNNIANLDDTYIRDYIKTINFFNIINYDEILNWLIKNSTKMNDLYMEDVKGLRIKFIKIDGKFFIETFSTSTIEKLIKGDSEDPEGFWDIKYQYL